MKELSEEFLRKRAIELIEEKHIIARRCAKNIRVRRIRPQKALINEVIKALKYGV